MCEAFIAWASRHHWTAYPETAGWDIVLVRPNGIQIGVQAKLRFNMKVLAQTLPKHWGDDAIGPDYRAILVGAKTDTAAVCEHLGIACFCPQHRPSGRPQEFGGDTAIIDLDRATTFWRYGPAWFDWNPERRIELPDYVPDVPAGASAPVQLTPWKIGALRLIAILEIRGYLTRADFREYGINPTRWTVHYRPESAWLLKGQVHGQWIRGPALDFERQHPDVYAMIRADIAAKLGKAA